MQSNKIAKSQPSASSTDKDSSLGSSTNYIFPLTPFGKIISPDKNSSFLQRELDKKTDSKTIKPRGHEILQAAIQDKLRSSYSTIKSPRKPDSETHKVIVGFNIIGSSPSSSDNESSDGSNHNSVTSPSKLTAQLLEQKIEKFNRDNIFNQDIPLITQGERNLLPKIHTVKPRGPIPPQGGKNR